MRKTLAVVAIAMLMIASVLMMATPASARPPVRSQWTVMIYEDGDSNLEICTAWYLERLESVGSTDEVKFVVLLDTLSGPASLLYVNKGSLTVLDDWGEMNMADPATLTAFIKAAEKVAPAEKYALFDSSHGGGWIGLNWDFSSFDANGAMEYMNMNEFREAIVGAGLCFDVFTFCGCEMGQAEVAYQLNGYANYVVFSEDLTRGAGFPYHLIGSDLITNPDMDGGELATKIVQYHGYFYESFPGYGMLENDCTMSAFDMSYIDDLTNAMTVFAEESLDALGEYEARFKCDQSSAQSYYDSCFVDLKDYAMNIIADDGIKDNSLKAAAAEVIDTIDAGVLAMYNGVHNRNSYGVSIYLPVYRNGWTGYMPSYADVPFAIDTGWLLFVEAFAVKI